MHKEASKIRFNVSELNFVSFSAHRAYEKFIEKHDEEMRFCIGWMCLNSNARKTARSILFHEFYKDCITKTNAIKLINNSFLSNNESFEEWKNLELKTIELFDGVKIKKKVFHTELKLNDTELEILKKLTTQKMYAQELVRNSSILNPNAIYTTLKRMIGKKYLKSEKNKAIGESGLPRPRYFPSELGKILLSNNHYKMRGL